MDPLTESLFIHNRLLYHNLANSSFRDEHLQLQRFIEALGRYATSANEGYCDLHRNRNYISMAHLIRMMADACFCAYGLLICNDKEKYLNSFFEGLPLNKCKKDNEQLTSGVIKKYIEADYPGIAKVYDISNKFIHPSGFYYNDIRSPLKECQTEDDLLSDYSSLYNKEDVQLLDGLMQDLNEILLDILRKLKDAFEPPIILGEIIDLDTGKLIPNPKCNPDK